jgi:hypothetical protein
MRFLVSARVSDRPVQKLSATRLASEVQKPVASPPIRCAFEETVFLEFSPVQVPLACLTSGLT